MRHSLRNEESNPSSPSSSFIIKNSPPESARSSYSGSECESRDFDAILGRPATSGPTSFLCHAVQEYASKQIADVDEVASIASLRVTSPKTDAQTSSDEVENLLLSPTSNSSKHTEMAAENRWTVLFPRAQQIIPFSQEVRTILRCMLYRVYSNTHPIPLVVYALIIIIIEAC